MQLMQSTLHPMRRALLVSRASLVYRIAMRLPAWVPVYVFSARVGDRTDTHAEIGRCG